jgi:enoyl-CoA hydratase/carnithine racemase
VSDYETLLFESTDGVAWLTLNRPDVHNAFNLQMQDELADVWKRIAHDKAIRCTVLTGAGEKAFCVGIDRNEALTAETLGEEDLPGYNSPWVYDDPGRRLGPKANELWKPVIAAVNGMAAGGAFYFLGEVDFIIAADHATFFDPHVTFGMTSAFEPIQLLQKMPFQEVMRMALLGNHERMSAQRACDIGLVSQIVPLDQLEDTARWAAQAIASAPPLNVVGTVRALWMGLEVNRRQALDLASLYTYIGSDRQALLEGQKNFGSAPRVEWRKR